MATVETSVTGNPGWEGNASGGSIRRWTGTGSLGSSAATTQITVGYLTPTTFVHVGQMEAGELGLVEIKSARIYGIHGKITVGTPNGANTAAERDFYFCGENR